jgi:hypothetical protein
MTGRTMPSHTNPWQVRITLLLAVLILIPSGYGFAGKFIELVRVYRGEADGAFAVAPMMNYLLASLGFFCLLLWAAAHGMFRDIESPKYDMLAHEELLDN